MIKLLAIFIPAAFLAFVIARAELRHLEWDYPSNELGKVYFQVESSTNLTNWTVIDRVTNSTRSRAFDTRTNKVRVFRLGREWK